MAAHGDFGLAALVLFPEEPRGDGPSAAFELAADIRDSLKGDAPYSDQRFLEDLRRLAKAVTVTKEYLDGLVGGSGTDRQD